MPPVAAARPPAIAVLDLGRNRAQLAAVDPERLTVLGTRRAPAPPVVRPPYPHRDLERIGRWLLAALADLAENWEIVAIVPTGEGGGAVLIDEGGPVLPSMDPQAPIPPGISVGSVWPAVTPTRWRR